MEAVPTQLLCQDTGKWEFNAEIKVTFLKVSPVILFCCCFKLWSLLLLKRGHLSCLMLSGVDLDLPPAHASLC